MSSTSPGARTPTAWFPAVRFLTAAAVAFALAAVDGQQRVPAEAAPPQAESGGPRIDISFSAEARAEAVTGMVYVAISRDNQRPPIEQAAPTGVPLFSKFVEGLAPGAVATIGPARSRPSARQPPRSACRRVLDAALRQRLHALPASGRARPCGCTTTSGKDRTGSGRQGTCWAIRSRSPSIRQSTTPIRLVAMKAIPPIQPPADTAMVKRIKIQSRILTKWWGQPIFLGATVLLPKDYDKHPDVRYPVNYVHGHFSLGAPGGFGRGGQFDQALARGRHAAFPLRHAAAPLAVLRRLLRRELGEQRAVRRRHHPGADPRRRAAHSAPSGSRGPACCREDRPEAGSPPRTRSSTRTSTAAPSRAVPMRWISRITRSSTSTRMRTRTSSTRDG